MTPTPSAPEPEESLWRRQEAARTEPFAYLWRIDPRQPTTVLAVLNEAFETYDDPKMLVARTPGIARWLVIEHNQRWRATHKAAG